MELLSRRSRGARQQWPHLTTQLAAAGMMEHTGGENSRPGARQGHL